LEDIKDTVSFYTYNNLLTIWIMNSPSYLYMAEYCTQCVTKIRETALGPPDKILQKIQSWLKDQKINQTANSLDRRTWNDSMDVLIAG
jgi:hypothetical protein